MKTRRRLAVAAIVFVLLAVVGFFAVPPIAKAQLERRLSAALGRTVTVDRVRLNPFTLSVTLEKFDLREKDGRASFVGWDRLFVNFDALASLTGDWVFSQIELDGLHASVEVNADASYNFSDLLARFSAPSVPAGAPAAVASPPDKAPRPIRVGSLKVTGAGVSFNDRSRAHPFSSIVGPLTFALTEFRTAGGRGAPYHFVAATEAGEKLTWTGTLAADPVESHGEFALENLILKKYTPYFDDKVRGDITSGTVTVRGRYEANFDAKKRALQLVDGELHLRDLNVAERGGATVVGLPSLDVAGIQADAIAFKASAASVALAGGHIALRREKDGSINLLTMLAPGASSASLPSSPPASPANPAGAPIPAKLPEVMAGEITLKDFKVDVTDLAVPRPTQLALGGLQVSVKNATLSDGAVMPLSVAFDWAPHGTVQVAGSVTLKPALTADLKTDVSGFELLPLSPYLEQFINARVTRGAVSTSNTVHFEQLNGRPAVTLSGGLSVEHFGLVDGDGSQELAGVASILYSMT